MVANVDALVRLGSNPHKATMCPGRMKIDMGKQVLILAGPNGAGKTTFAREFLTTEANCPTFLNADIIAAELSPQHPRRLR